MAAAAPPGADASARRVDFYVLSGTDPRVRLKLACRLAEKAYLAGQRVFIWSDDAPGLASMDELLWSFADRSFVPHELYTEAQQWLETPVLLSCGPQPSTAFEVLINLGSTVPASAAQARRVIELIDADEARRRAGRERFRHYRGAGLTPQTHQIVADETP